MTTAQARMEAVMERVRRAEGMYGRTPGSVTVIAVGKRHSVAALRALHDAGQRNFGENYVQEGIGKMEQLAGLELTWHYVGALQSNKSRGVAEHFDWVHTVDRLKVAERLSRQRPGDLAPLQLCIQVNVSGEPQKAGCPPEEVQALTERIAELPRVRLRGLMALPEPAEEFEAQRRPFARLRELLEACTQAGYGMDTLSMGMSADLEAAIAEGATHLRVGTALFGPRPVTQEDAHA